MRIVLLEAFYSGSHQLWADGFKKYSKHNITILSLKGKHWKWRMHGGAISLAKQFLELDFSPDLILATDMLDFSLFLALTKHKMLLFLQLFIFTKINSHILGPLLT